MAGKRDNISHMRLLNAILPIAAATPDIVGIIIDTLEFDSHSFGYQFSGSDEAVPVVLTVEHGDDIALSDGAVAPGEDVLVGALTTNEQGSVNSLTVPTGAAGTAKIGYVGDKRYIRLLVAKGGTSSTSAATCISSHADVTPVA